MKQVVNGLLYDTETAELIHIYPPLEKPVISREWLYQTKKGSFFLRSVFVATERIYPLSEEEAMEWLGEHCGTEILLSRFPDKVEEA